MNFYTKIGVRLLVLANLFLAFNFIYEGSLWKLDRAELVPFLDDFEQGIEQADVLYFGDCSNAFFRPEDSSFTPISTFLDEQLPNQQVAAVSHDGFHAQVWQTLMGRLKPRDSVRIHTLVVTMNMRSFAPHIRLHKTENTLQRNLTLATNHPPLFNRIEVAFRAYPNLEPRDIAFRTHDAWNMQYTEEVSPQLGVETPAQLLNQLLTRAHTADDSAKIEAYVKNYGFEVQNNTALWNAFEQVAEVCRERDIRLVAVLLPENIQEASNVCGADFELFMKQQHLYMLMKSKQLGLQVVDLFDACQPEAFVEKLPNSHYTSAAREQIATAVAQALRQ